MKRVDGPGIKHFCDRLRVNVQVKAFNRRVEYFHHTHTYAQRQECAAKCVLPRAEIKGGDSDNNTVIAVITACSRISQPLLLCFVFSLSTQLRSLH